MTTTPRLRVWHREHGDGLSKTETAESLWFAESLSAPSDIAQQRALGVRPIVPRAAFIGVAVVPPELDQCVALNGTPLWSGIHGLRHGDRLGLNGHNIWVATSTVVEPVAYDPAVHGEGLVCYLTRDRIAPGDSIVRCPGTGGKSCNVIYKQQAWDLAMQATPPMRCANCDHQPGEAEWEPPRTSVKRQLHNVLASITNDRQ